MKLDLKLTYNRMSDDDLLAIVHSQADFRPGAQDLARAILLKRGISEDAISEWRDPATELAAIPWSSGMSDLKLRRMLKRRRQLDGITFYLLISLGILWFGRLWLSPDYNLFGERSSWRGV